MTGGLWLVSLWRTAEIWTVVLLLVDSYEWVYIINIPFQCSIL